MFLAPMLYALHAVATGISMALMDMLGIRLGFSFSAGLFDYVLNFSSAQRPLWLLPIGVVYFGVYYFGFRYCIVRFNLATPGREPEDAMRAAPAAAAVAGSRAEGFIVALGGGANLTEVEACTTRLRLGLVDGGRINEAALRQLGARGVVRPSPTSLQVVLGPVADQVAGEIRDALRATAAATAEKASIGHDARALLKMLGGVDNILELADVPGRLLLKLARQDAVDESGLASLGVRGIARTASGVQVLVAGPVESTAAPLRALLSRA
jgi:PTS system N-acetylglucosamine-specific IIC component